ncbi:MAG: redoxin domain-containing protein [Phycisphaerae bacterium]|nr:redoxin domain-containing protein [Phycisphaerae bacterium]
MRTAIIAILCVGFAFGGVARADLEKGTYAPDIEAMEWMNTEEPVSLAELRGMTVILFFWVTWHPGGEDVMPLMNLLNSQISRSRGVYLMGVTDSDRGRVEEMLKKHKVYFPVALESESHEDYQISTFPRVIVIDPNGKVAWTGWPGTGGGDALYKAVLDVIADTPPTKTHPKDAVVVKEKLRKARQALRGGDLQEAFKTAREASNLTLTGDELKTRCQDVLDLVEALGRDLLARAEWAADEKRFEDAVGLLHDIKREFKSLDVSRSARKKLDALQKKHDQVARILEMENEAQIAENLLQAALDDLRAKPRRIGKAFVKLEEIINEYSDSEAAAKAQTVMDRMHENDGVMDHVRDHQAKPECELWLSQARAWERAGRPGKAKELYRRIIDQHSRTIWADIAAQRLRQLP